MLIIMNAIVVGIITDNSKDWLVYPRSIPGFYSRWLIPIFFFNIEDLPRSQVNSSFKTKSRLPVKHSKNSQIY